MSITCTRLNPSNVKEFSEIKLELMEPQNQVRVETISHDLCFQGFGTSLMWMVWGPSYLTSNNESTTISGIIVATSCFFI